MNKYRQFCIAVAPTAMICALVVPASMAKAETAAKPIPKIRVPGAVPADDEKPKPRIRVPGAFQTAVTPADGEETRRLRTRVAAPVEETPSAAEAPAPARIRVRVPVPTSEATVPQNTPRIRTPVAVPAEKEASSEPATPRRVRGGTPRIDNTAPVESENTPYIRKRFATPDSETDAPNADDPAARRRRVSADSDTPVGDPVISKPPPRLTSIDDNGTSAFQRSFVGRAKPGAVVLKPGSHQQILNSLKVVRTLGLAELTANPTMTLGGTTFNFGPMLQNPKSIPNIANKLRAIPNLVEVRPGSGQLTASQTDRGFVVLSELSYNLKPGACRTAANRAIIAGAGISCFVYKNPATRDAAFSNPNAVEYVADPSARAKAMADARAQAEATAADIATSIAEFRSKLKDPAQRAEITAAAGETEVKRLEQMDNTALAGELANLHDVEIKETGFMPILNPNFAIDPAIFADRQRADRLVAADKQLAAPTESNSYDIPDEIFLTGFTVGSKDEWRKGISTTIKWCFVGCKRTYYVEAWAGFEYGFGLRFPMKFGGTYNYVAGNTNSANLNPLKLTMFDGNADDYRKAGLKEDHIFGGKEFVAQFGAHAGFAANLPFLPLINPPELNPKLDLTELEEFPWKGGQVSPPNPGEDESKEVYFRQVDLLNNFANLGFVAVKIHPAVQVGLTSEAMGLTVNGTQINNTTTTLALPIDGTGISSFTAKDPHYNIGLTLTPGLEARLTIDLAVWGTSLEWPVWLSAAKITLPPGGKTFSCHAGTSCSRDFMLSRDGAVTPFKRDLKNWGVAFDKMWLANCVDAICTTSVKLKRYDTIEWGFAQEVESPGIRLADINPQLLEARAAALKYANESVVRKAQKSSDTSAAMGNLAQAIYTPQCKDSLCADNVAALAALMGPRAQEIITYQRQLDPAAVNKMVNKEFGPKFVAEIDASKMRASMQQAKSVKNQSDQIGGKQPTVPTTRCKNMRCATPN